MYKNLGQYSQAINFHQQHLTTMREFAARQSEGINMAQVKVFYEPETELLTVFWQPPRKAQISTELGDGIILIKDSATGEPIRIEILSYHPGDYRFDAVSVELGQVSPAQ